jgi:hypothetical protein
MTPKCSQRQLELPTELPPCRTRNHTRGLKSLAERLEAAIDRIANDETISPELLEFVVWKLSLALDGLKRRLARDQRLALVARELNPRTRPPFI